MLLLTMLTRLTRRWNQSGQKYSGSPDIARSFLPGHPLVLFCLVVATYCDTFWELRQRSLNKDPNRPLAVTIAAFLLTLTALAFKVVFTFIDSPELFSTWTPIMTVLTPKIPGLVPLARLLFAGILVFIIILALFPSSKSPDPRAKSIRQAGEFSDPSTDHLAFSHRLIAVSLLHTIQPLITIILLTQSRITNVPLFLVFKLQSRLIYDIQTSNRSVTLITLIMAHVSFFAMGETNSISSIDLANAYNGVMSYSVVAVGFLLFISNWAGPIYWSVTGLHLIFQKAGEQARDLHEATERALGTAPVWIDPSTTRARSSPPGSDKPKRKCLWNAYLQHVGQLTLFMCIASFGVMAACTALRAHLFVWTVFSPKYLYMVTWFVGWHFGVNILFGGSMALLECLSE